MTRTVSSIVRVAPVKGMFGVEVELEGTNFPHNRVLGWKREHDGSLRGQDNAEYVLSKPLDLDEVKKAISRLKKAFKDNNTTIDPSTRTGLHIHVNVGDMVTKQLFNFICTYLIFERSFLNLCHKSRRGNHFCLRSCDAEFLIENLQRVVTEERYDYLADQNVRYAAMNTNSIGKYGSLEFRFMESMGDFDTIIFWCEILQKLRDFSVSVENPRKILEMFSMNGYKDFCQEVLGKYADLVLKQPTYHKDLRQGMIYSQDIAYGNEWENNNLNIFMQRGGF